MSKNNLKSKQKKYKQMADKNNPKPPLLKNIVYAFLFGGTVSLIGQFLINFYISIGFSADEASNPMVATLIFLGSLLTGLGYYDDLARFAGAGLAIPVTGFANSITSSAMEFKREGLVLGIGSKMFSLAGSVIVFGVITAFVIGLISAII